MISKGDSPGGILPHSGTELEGAMRKPYYIDLKKWGLPQRQKLVAAFVAQ
jgi:hypothetical protein